MEIPSEKEAADKPIVHTYVFKLTFDEKATWLVVPFLSH